MVKKVKELDVDVADTIALNAADEVSVSPTEGLSVIDEEDIPFLKKNPRVGIRPWRGKVTDEPVVEIAGKTFTLRDVEDKEVVDLNLIGHRFRESKNILASSARNPSIGHSGYWETTNVLSRKDVKFKHVNIDGVDIYISNGSRLIVTESFSTDEYYNSHTGKSTIKPVLILLASEIKAKSLTLVGKTVLRNSTISNEGSITLIDATLRTSSVSSNGQYSTIDSSFFQGCYISTGGAITISDANISELSVNGVGTLSFDRVTGGYGFNLTAYGQGSAGQISLAVFNQCLYEHNFHPYGINDKDYSPALDFPKISNLTLEITKRIDYGMFAGTRPLPFVRMNQADIMVEGQIFSVKEFFPELLTKQEPPKIQEEGYRPGGFFPSPMPAYTPVHGNYSRGSALWNKAAAIAFGKEKAVIGKIGESIVTSLLDQIRSRINLYIETSTLN
ncbi:hypothetical protein AH04_174 [Erwinia phage AH04]|uniref:Uncharacterized protein n=1 Tax=Erwinia phage AH04 TaxID=2869569 RepID=A0AAE8BQ57_9CAUD|nr:hypothetical protein PQC02_gp140 [Erwinia phage AH04]QZA70649.1 hypothetical protein AH04_174 [Erwinia phage AH04]